MMRLSRGPVIALEGKAFRTESIYSGLSRIKMGEMGSRGAWPMIALQGVCIGRGLSPGFG